MILFWIMYKLYIAEEIPTVQESAKGGTMLHSSNNVWYKKTLVQFCSLHY